MRHRNAGVNKSKRQMGLVEAKNRNEWGMELRCSYSYAFIGCVISVT